MTAASAVLVATPLTALSMSTGAHKRADDLTQVFQLLADAPSALALAESRTVAGKVVLVPGADELS